MNRPEINYKHECVNGADDLWWQCVAPAPLPLLRESGCWLGGSRHDLLKPEIKTEKHKTMVLTSNNGNAEMNARPNAQITEMLKYWKVSRCKCEPPALPRDDLLAAYSSTSLAVRSLFPG